MILEYKTKATAEQLTRLAKHGYLNGDGLERALTLAGTIPTGQTWLKFLDIALLSLGVAFTLSGIIFFFAYNWANMAYFLKFGLIESGILLAIGFAHYRGLDKFSGQVGLMSAAILIGALLAVQGQVYQTGADAYQLFLSWAILIADCLTLHHQFFGDRGNCATW